MLRKLNKKNKDRGGKRKIIEMRRQLLVKSKSPGKSSGGGEKTVQLWSSWKGGNANAMVERQYSCGGVEEEAIQL